MTSSKQAKMLNTPTGQLIIAAAVLDDVIALLLLSELQAPRTVHTSYTLRARAYHWIAS